MTAGYSTRSGTSCSSCRVVQHAADAALQPLRFGVELPRDLVVTLAAFEDDEVFEQPRAILVERANLDGSSCAPARREEPVAVRHRAGRDVLDLSGLRARRPRNRERHDASAVGVENPADGTPEQQLALAVFEHGVPAHQLRERQRAQRPAERVGQDVDGRLPSKPLTKREVLALRSLHPFQRRHFDAVLRRKPGGGRRGRAIGGKAGRDRRPVDDLLEVGLALRNSLDSDHQAPRRAVRLDSRFRRQPPLAQLRRQRFTDLIRQLRQPARRNFLAPELEQQFAVHGYATTAGDVCSTYAFAMPTAR